MDAARELFSGLWSVLSAALLALGLTAAPEPVYFQGYVEGEFVLVAPTLGGRLNTLSVRRGAQVALGQPLFQLEAEEETAMRDQARAALAEAEGRLANLLKGRRQAELDGIAARKAQAEAQVRLAKQQLTRQQRLAESPAFSPEQLDQARANYDLQKARVDELTAELADAQAALGRDDEVAAARAAVQQQQAGLAQAEWRLGQRRRVAPAAGLVADTYFNPGETVGAGQPVVSILPPENRKVRFFVPETLLATLPVGAAVTIRCDGCGEGLAATVRFVAAEAEYTPPVLYNRDNRNRLLYLMEAWPAAAAAERLRPGQPVDVLPRAP